MARRLFITLVVTLTFFLVARLHAKQETDFTATELLGRYTDSSVTVNVIADEDLEVLFEYGTGSGVHTGLTDLNLGKNFTGGQKNV